MEGKALSPALEARIREAVTRIMTEHLEDTPECAVVHAECDHSEGCSLYDVLVVNVSALVSDAQREQREADADEDLALLRAADVVPDEDGRLLVNLNDVWAWASSDCEEVTAAEVPRVAELYRLYGWCGLLYWCSEKRGGLRSEFRDNNRFIDFVRHEEALRQRVPDSNKRAYTDITYTLGAAAIRGEGGA